MAKKLYTSPLGVAVYPHLNTPDTKYVPEGLFSVKLRIAGEDASEFMARIDKAIDQSVSDAKNEAEEGDEIKRADPPYSTKDQADGVVLFHFKVKHRNKDRLGAEYFRRPVLFDSQGARCDDARIGGGSELRISYEPFLFHTKLIGAGVSLRLFAVQVVKLIEWGERDAEGYGLGVLPGGYARPNAEESGFEATTEVDQPESQDKKPTKFDF